MSTLARRLAHLEQRAVRQSTAAATRARLLARIERRLEGLGQRLRATADLHGRTPHPDAGAPSPLIPDLTGDHVRTMVFARLRALGFPREAPAHPAH